jgi:hypothetical protein
MPEAAHTESAIIAKMVGRMWGLSLDSWNNLIVAFLALGGLAAVAVGVATYAAFQ